MEINVNHKKVLLFLSALLVAASLSHAAKADQYYPLIKVTCDKESQTITLRPYLHEGKDSKQLIKDIEDGKIKDGYSFNAMAKSKQRITCDLGNGHTIFFGAFKSDTRPGNDNIEMFIDEDHAPVWIPTGPIQDEIHFLSVDDYTAKECPLSARGDSIQEDKCKYVHVVNGKRVDDQPSTQEAS